MWRVGGGGGRGRGAGLCGVCAVCVVCGSVVWEVGLGRESGVGRWVGLFHFFDPFGTKSKMDLNF